MRTFVLAIAPGIPPEEVTALEGQIAESIKDPSIPTVVRYHANVQHVSIHNTARLFVVAPGAPPSGLDGLRSKLLDPAVGVIVVPFDVAIMEF
jgi:hypothetical protein